VDEVYTLKVVGLNTDITYVHGLCPRHMPTPHADASHTIRPHFSRPITPRRRPERLREIFSAFGFISTIYYPVDLRTLRTRDFALVRFIEEKDAREAQRRLDGQDVGRYCLHAHYHCITALRATHRRRSFPSSDLFRAQRAAAGVLLGTAEVLLKNSFRHGATAQRQGKSRRAQEGHPV
jgi:hypothetical protein